LKIIVITGSTRGIGFGLAEEFLRLGQSVIISGRTQESVTAAVQKLAQTYPAQQITGTPCDMRYYDQVQELWAFASDHFGQVDIWINNAGIAQAQSKFWDLDVSQIEDLVDTNILGAMNGAKVALAGFIKQGGGAFYNMEGLGSDGRQVEGLTLYGTSKRALSYLTDSLAAEVKGSGVIVGAISPGMVLTDLILKQYQDKKPAEWASARRIFNILMDKVETVTPFLAEKILKNKKNGARIKWLTGWKASWRFLTASISKRDLFSDLDM
jgi:NAD(P)-dependent dehydrogenase (short-subunit alcohol dehydrogenase family)